MHQKFWRQEHQMRRRKSVELPKWLRVRRRKRRMS
jgi:hypothetical protein